MNDIAITENMQMFIAKLLTFITEEINFRINMPYKYH